MGQGTVTDLGGMYREVRERLTTLVLSLNGAQFDAQVPACPAWTVGDVLAHLVASPEDVLLSWLEVPVPLRVVTEDDEYIAGPEPRQAGNEPVPADEPELALVTSKFEAFRWRMGRMRMFSDV